RVGGGGRRGDGQERGEREFHAAGRQAGGGRCQCTGEPSGVSRRVVSLTPAAYAAPLARTLSPPLPGSFPMPYILALDSGTTSARAILFDHGGAVRAVA